MNRALAVLIAAMLQSALVQAQASAPACTQTGPRAVPTSIVPGTDDGPHTFIVDGVRLWYCVAGRGRADASPVVFLHGGPGQGSYYFAALTGPLLEPSTRMIYFDQRGSGRSERPWTHDYALPRLVEDIEALRRTLGVSRIALIAHSFAGALALEYAAKYPEHVARIVMLDAISDLPVTARSVCERLAQTHPDAYSRSGPEGGAPADAADCNVTRALTGPALTRFFRDNAYPDPVIEKRVDSVYKASGLQNTGELSRALFNGSSSITGWRFTAYDRLTMPVLVLVGQQDYQVGVRAPRELAAKLPRARFILYEHSGHYPNLDEPGRFVADVLPFLSADAEQ